MSFWWETTFSIHQTNELPKGEGVWTYFECENQDSYVEQLLQKGIEFAQLPNDMPWLWGEAWL